MATKNTKKSKQFNSRKRAQKERIFLRKILFLLLPLAPIELLITNTDKTK